MNRLAVLFLFSASTVVASDHQLKPVRIAVPVDGHIHPAACVTRSGTIVVTYGRVNHVDLRITRSSDGGMTWSEPVPFVHTVDKTYYPGSLTTLSDGRLVHCWNRWDTPVTQKEPRSVLYSLSSDEGDSWSDPQPFPRDPEVRSVTRHPVTELKSGQWLVSFIDRTFVFDPATSKATPFGDGRDHGLIPIRADSARHVRQRRRSPIDGRRQDVEDHRRLSGHQHAGLAARMVGLKNGWLLASEILGPGFGGERIRYRISYDDGQTWDGVFEYYNPGRAINGRACPRTVQLDDKTIGVVFYDIDKDQEGGPGVFFLRIPIAKLAAR